MGHFLERPRSVRDGRHVVTQTLPPPTPLVFSFLHFISEHRARKAQLVERLASQLTTKQQPNMLT